jgi:hypothetical protein
MDIRICSICGQEYNASAKPNGHKCTGAQMQDVAYALWDCGEDEEAKEAEWAILESIEDEA